MKIKKIEFKKHRIFNNHSLIFGDVDIPSITFLVGNNGSGKTKVLDMIYSALTTPFDHPGDYEVILTLLLSAKEMEESSLTIQEIIYSIKKENGKNRHQVADTSGSSIALNIQELSKIVFSTIEVNFNEQQISSVTSKDIDQVLKPKEKSQNLATEIPQLLVDIKNLDDSDIAKWYRTHRVSGHPNPFPAIGSRLERFVKAFHDIYGGEKTFSDIKNDNGSKKIIFTDSMGNEIGLNDLSTGEKQIIYRVGYILKNQGNIHGGIVLIDEPEISLHPTWQIKLKDFLLAVFNGFDVQIIIATHSPYIFQSLNETSESCVKIDRAKPISEKIQLVFPRVPYTPTVQLISYLAYGIATELLHIELYTLLQIREKRDHILNSRGSNDGIENWLQDTAGGSIPIEKTFTRTGQSTPTNETIMTWIRNKIHHPDESARPNFNPSDLKKSIDEMIKLLSV